MAVDWARDIFSCLYFAFLIILNTFTYFTTLILFSFNYFYVAITERFFFVTLAMPKFQYHATQL